MKFLLSVIATWLLCASTPAGLVHWVGDKPTDAIFLKLSISNAPDIEGSHRLARSLLAHRAYYWPELRQSDSGLYIWAGPPGQLGSIQIDGMDQDSAQGVRAFSTATRGQAHESALSGGVAAVVNHLVNQGYLYAQVWVAYLDATDRPFLNVALRAYPGAHVFGRRLLTGAKRTRSEVFARETDWARGQLLTGARIDNVTSSLDELPYVVRADSALILSVTSDTADLFVAVQEAAGIGISGIAGWVPAGGTNEDGYWGGSFDLQLRSPFGDGRSVELKASRRDPESKHTQFTFWEPWPLGVPVWAGLSLVQDDFGADFIETQARLHLRLASVSPRWTMFLGVGRITIEEEPSPETFSGDRFEAGVEVSDSSGRLSYRFGVQWNRQQFELREGALAPQSSLQFTRAEFGVSRWLRARRTLWIHALADGAGLLSGATFAPPNQRHRVGGVYSLRGYREEEFLVRDYLRAGLEWHAGSRAQSLFVFAEAAWLNQTQSLNRVLGAAGVGLNIGARAQLLWAVPSEGGVGASKIHIGLSTLR